MRSIPSIPMSPARIRQLLRRNPMLADGLLVVTVWAIAVVTEITVVANQMVEFKVGVPPPTPVIVVWAAAMTVPLLWRRRFPCAVLILVIVHFPFYWARVDNTSEIASSSGPGSGGLQRCGIRRTPARGLVLRHRMGRAQRLDIHLHGAPTLGV